MERVDELETTWAELRAERDRELRLRRLRRRFLVVAVVGLAAASAAVLGSLHLAVYLGGLALVTAGMVGLCSTYERGRRRLLLICAVLVLAATSVLLPWWSADRARSGAPHWSVDFKNVWGDVYVDGGLAFVGLRGRGYGAVNLADGSVRWTAPLSSAFVTSDGTVVGALHDSGHDFVAMTMLDRDGQTMWQWVDAEADNGEARQPIASRSGVTAFQVCAGSDDLGRLCRVVGIGPEGDKVWERQVDDQELFREWSHATVEPRWDDMRLLAEIVLVSVDGGAMTEVLRADTGEVLHRLDAAVVLGFAGDHLAYQSGPAEEPGLCRTHGVSIDGSVSWDADTPCQLPGTGHGLLVGDIRYSTFLTAEPDPARSIALDIRTGSWRDVGALSSFSSHADAVTSVGGADVVVEVDGAHLTATDVRTGAELWQHTAPGDGPVGVEISRDAVVVHAGGGTSYNPFLADILPRKRSTVLVLDPRTGVVTGRLVVSDGPWGVMPAGPGQALISDHGELFLIGSAPR